MRYTLVLIFLTTYTHIFSQTDSLVYYRPCYYSQYLLDSLDIPFIPLDLRADPNYNNYRYIDEFNEFFKQDLVYLPDNQTPSFDLFDYVELFGEYYRFLVPDGVVGDSFLKLEGHPKYGLLRIIESFNINKESEKRIYYFSTTLYGLDYNGQWDMITDSDVSHLPKFSKSYME